MNTLIDDNRYTNDCVDLVLWNYVKSVPVLFILPRYRYLKNINSYKRFRIELVKIGIRDSLRNGIDVKRAFNILGALTMEYWGNEIRYMPLNTRINKDFIYLIYAPVKDKCHICTIRAFNGKYVYLENFWMDDLYREPVDKLTINDFIEYYNDFEHLCSILMVCSISII